MNELQIVVTLSLAFIMVFSFYLANQCDKAEQVPMDTQQPEEEPRKYLTMWARENGQILVVHGHGDIGEHVQLMDLADALKMANDHNECRLHPDEYVATPHHLQVVRNDEIIGFVEKGDNPQPIKW